MRSLNTPCRDRTAAAAASCDAAIVTEIPGTTRDVLREHIDLDGMPLHVVDTAGLRLTDDRVEAEGVRRARMEIERADALLYVVDATTDDELPSDRSRLTGIVGVALPRHVLVLRNKMDLSPVRRSPTELPVLEVSALTGRGLEALTSELERMVGFVAGEGSTFTARARHLEALERTDDALAAGLDTLLATGAGDLVAEDLRRAHGALGSIVGEVTPDDLLGEIFSSFCIGK
jgi:tRNA modification GTPase